MMLLNKEKPVVSVSTLIHSNSQNANNLHAMNSGMTRNAWQAPLWSESLPPQHPSVGIVTGLNMSGGGVGGGLGRQSPPLTPIEGMGEQNNFNGTPGVNGGAPASPSFTIGSPSSSSSYPPSVSVSSPPNAGGFASHPLSVSKHYCAICDDRASGKHYGVFSCEGCKGFFKRTVRKELQYSCRENKSCVIDKRHRNRCQYCRYHKCLSMGMKREAVQEERQRSNNKSTADKTLSLDMSITSIKDAEIIADPEDDMKPFIKEEGLQEALVHGVRKQLNMLFVWAKHVPHFRELPLGDQLLLLKNGWNELLISALAFRSTVCQDTILLANGVQIDRDRSCDVGLGETFDRILAELILKMKDMNIDREEMACLRAIVLFNPDVKGLTNASRVENLRERVYSSLEEYTKLKDNGRFAKLLLRLPALRSIGLRCQLHLFYASKETTTFKFDSRDMSHIPTIEDHIVNKLSDEPMVPQ